MRAERQQRSRYGYDYLKVTDLRDLIKSVCSKTVDSEFEIKHILLDFEKPAHNAVKKLFPNAIIQGCKFHLGQSFWRKIHSLPKLRFAYYAKKSDSNGLKKWLQLFFSLSYLHPDNVSEAFTEIYSIAPSIPQADKFADCVLKTYIDLDTCLYPPSMWAFHCFGE